MSPASYELGELLYRNPLAGAADLATFRMEGPGVISFPLGRLRLESTADPQAGQAANLVLWCAENFPSDIAVSWDFFPLHEPGLCILFFAARGRRGEDLFDPELAERGGPYDHYHHGDIDAYHVSYFRRRYPEEQRFHTCNLRKSHGFHLVAQGADPIPSVIESDPPYRIKIVKCGGEIEFSIDGLTSFRWSDDGRIGGPPLTAGKIGFRQMAPLIAEYANLEVRAVVRGSGTDSLR